MPLLAAVFTELADADQACYLVITPDAEQGYLPYHLTYDLPTARCPLLKTRCSLLTMAPLTTAPLTTAPLTTAPLTMAPLTMAGGQAGAGPLSRREQPRLQRQRPQHAARGHGPGPSPGAGLGGGAGDGCTGLTPTPTLNLTPNATTK
jgi:hypothetical protein